MNYFLVIRMVNIRIIRRIMRYMSSNCPHSAEGFFWRSCWKRLNSEVYAERQGIMSSIKIRKKSGSFHFEAVPSRYLIGSHRPHVGRTRKNILIFFQRISIGRNKKGPVLVSHYFSRGQYIKILATLLKIYFWYEKKIADYNWKK